MSEAGGHEPVMVEEVVDLLRPIPAGIVVDATVGLGGHARALLAALDHVRLVGLDQDADALAAASRALAEFGDRATLVQARFDEFQERVDEQRAVASHDNETSQTSETTETSETSERGGVSGVLFDLGVSSPQLDRAERGFAYRADGPLDMRMDQRRSKTAADVVNGYDEARLAAVIARYGEERYARRVARAIVAARPLLKTGELADVVRNAIPAPARRRGGDPARRTFQALRIEVNDELDVLRRGLDQAIDALAPGGRCVVLAYHSGEDRIVKERFRTGVTGGCVCPPGLPCVCGARPTLRLVTRGARRPTSIEVARNHRAESARLRAAEKLPPEASGLGGDVGGDDAA